MVDRDTDSVMSFDASDKTAMAPDRMYITAPVILSQSSTRGLGWGVQCTVSGLFGSTTGGWQKINNKNK